MRPISPVPAEPSPPHALSSNHPVWLQVGTLLNGLSTTPLRSAHIVYDAQTIQYIAPPNHPPPATLLKPGQRAPDHILPNHTILPGLIEAHAHLFLEGGELDLEKRQAYLKKSPTELLTLATERLEKLL